MSEKLKPHIAYRKPGVISLSNGANMNAYEDRLKGDELVKFIFRDRSRRFLYNTLKLSHRYVQSKMLEFEQVSADQNVSAEDLDDELKNKNNPEQNQS